MVSDRIQKRKDRKSDRAQKKTEKKARRAAEDDSDPAGVNASANRVARLMRTAEPELEGARPKLVAGGSAFGAEALGAARALLAALDALLDRADPAAPIAVVEARTVLESALADIVARDGGAAGSLAHAPPRTLPPPFGAAEGDSDADDTAPAGGPSSVPRALRLPAEPGPVGPRAAAAPERSALPSFMRAPATPPAVAMPTPVAPPAMVTPGGDGDDLGGRTTADAPSAPRSAPPAATPTDATMMTTSFDVAKEVDRPLAGALPFTPGRAGPQVDPLQRFTLPVYAAVCAELQTHPHLAQAILARYGLTDPNVRDAVDRGHKAKIASDPAVRQTFEDLYTRALTGLRSP